MSVPRRVLVPAAAAAVALLTLAALAVLAGASPLDALRALALGSLGSRAAIGETLLRSTGIVLTGAGACLALRAGVLNIGLEGQFLAGAAAAAAVGPALAGAPFVARAAILLTAALAGALWVLPAAVLAAKRNVPEVLSTILLNLIAATAAGGLVRGALRDPAGDYPQSRALPDAVRLEPLFSGGRATAAVLVAFLGVAILAVLVSATPLGLKLRAVGLAPAAAHAIGLADARLKLLAFAGSGALAGLAGGLEVLGVTGRLYDPFASGVGYTGLAAALLGQAQPVASAFAGLFFAALGAGSSAMQRDTGVPAALAALVPGVLVLAVLAARARAGRNGS